MNFEATVEHIELDNYFSSKNDKIDPKLQGESCNARNQTDVIEKMQEALIPFCSSAKDWGMFCRQGNDVDVQPSMEAVNACSYSTNCERIYTDNVVKVVKTTGINRFQATINISTSDNFVFGSVSLTLRLQPFINANFDLINKVSDLLKEIGFCEISHGKNNLTSNAIVGKKGSYSQLVLVSRPF